MKFLSALVLCAISLTALRVARALTVGDPAQPQLLPAQLAQAYESGKRQITIAPGTYLLPYKDSDLFRLKG